MGVKDKMGVRVIVQASSRSWSGGRDLCMATLDDHPVVYWTIKRILDHIPNAEVSIAAPAFDREGELDLLVNLFPPGTVAILYGHDASPLNRMVDVCRDLSDDEYIIRADGLNFCVDTSLSLKMLDLARLKRLDCVKMPDDFPVQFTSDIYRVGALRNLDKLLDTDTQAIYRVHPKFYMFMQKAAFRCAYLQELPQYSDDHLRQCRRAAQAIYVVPRLEVNERRIWSGDQLSFHYELALENLQPWMKVLDVACGDGYGARMLARQVTEVHGADSDAEAINQARQHTDILNVQFYVEDVTRMTFGDNEFDAVTCMETIEHVDDGPCLREIHRVLKPGGILILSTPQNRLGRVPVNASHVREYSLDEIVKSCSQCFTVKTVIGIKAGRIIVPDDPHGTNTVLVCKKEFLA